MPKRGGPGGNRIWSSRGNRQNDNHNYNDHDSGECMHTLMSGSNYQNRHFAKSPFWHFSHLK